MKICPSCGIPQSDKRVECVECGARLDEPISEQEERRLLARQEAQIEKLYNRGDPLHVSLFDKIMGWVMLALFLAIPVTLILCRGWLKANQCTFLAGLFLALGALEAFFPQLGWALEKLRMSFSANGTEDLTPSHAYFTARKFSQVLCLLLGALFFYGMMTVEP